MKQFLHNYKLKLTAISPIHIGNGELYEPTNYVIDEGQLYYFNDTTLISKLNTQQIKDLMNIVSKNNSYQELQLFYKRKDIKNLAKNCSIYNVPVAEDIEKNYNESLGRVRQKEGNNSEVFNALSINPTIKTSFMPYIPGSSFKGALKTAFFSKEAQNRDFKEVAFEKKDSKGNFKDYRFNSKFFGQFETDPFSKLKISDFIPKEVKLEIKWGVNKKKKSNTADNDNTAIRYEFIAPLSEFVAELTIFDLIDKNILNNINKIIRNPKKQFHQPDKIYIQKDIIQITNSFYIPKFEEEKDWANSKNNLISSNYFQRAFPYLKKAKNGNGFLIRIGRHSGAESMTLDKYRKIFIPQMKKDANGNNLSRKEKYVSSPFTYWLASNVNAVKSAEFIGWLYCEFIDDNEYKESVSNYEIFLKKQKQKLEETEKEILNKEQQLFQEKEKIAIQKEQEELEKQKLLKEEQERLAKMSPLERKIYELQKNNPNPNETIDILLFNAIKKGDLEEFKCEALQKLKEEMIKLKKWVENSKKPKKDKKYKRTQEVISMLKECN